MNPYIIIVALVAILGAGAGGFKLGVDHETASQERDQQRMEKAAQAAAVIAADAIANIKVVNTTIQNEVQREIRTNTVYADCRHSDDGLRLVNGALAGSVAPGDSKLPPAHPSR